MGVWNVTFDPYQQQDQAQYGDPAAAQSGGQQSEDEDVEIDYEYSVSEEFAYSLDEVPEELRQGDESSSSDYIA